MTPVTLELVVSSVGFGLVLGLAIGLWPRRIDRHLRSEAALDRQRLLARSATLKSILDRIAASLEHVPAKSQPPAPPHPTDEG